MRTQSIQKTYTPLLARTSPLLLLLLLAACQPKEGQYQGKLFSTVEAQHSGITFANNLHENDTLNYFTYPYLYMGGGVAVGDVNNDGLQDLFFTANMEANRLYLNTGNLQFEDITQSAGVAGDGRWYTGATMVDVNNDGWQDIYVAVSGKDGNTRNQLYLNQKDNTFTEAAEALGLAQEDHTTQATWWDYDRDGDLDVFLVNYPIVSFSTPNTVYRHLMNKAEPKHSDRLLRNDGGHFTDVTEQVGMRNFGLGLSATASDLDGDGWLDLYVSNDFATPDFMYMNQGDGTFAETLQACTQQTSFYGMGSDIADFNNDGFMDIVQVDMAAEDNRRSKENMGGMYPERFWEAVRMGFHHQYMQNSLQLNRGLGTDGLPHFSNVARLAGVSNTDWSWGALFADLDNDGQKDLIISNGTRRDISNQDFFHELEKSTHRYDNLHVKVDEIPSEPLDNYVFRNNGNLQFNKANDTWGISFSGFTNGMAYADLDNDGDLEVVLNNLDHEAVLFENHASETGTGNHLRLHFSNQGQSIGARVRISHGGQHQWAELQQTRGFQSSVEPALHFGLGNATTIDELVVHWPNGTQEVLKNLPANQALTLEAPAQKTPAQLASRQSTMPRFEEVTGQLGLSYAHQEDGFDDFAHQVLMPHRMSTHGPGLAVADVNGDGLEDFYIGGATGQPGQLHLQQASGTFAAQPGPWTEEPGYEDMDALFFDADGNGTQDLYVVSGGNAYAANNAMYQDRLYLNNGQGQFTPATLPPLTGSGSCVAAHDFDADGDLDLFVGGRFQPRAYPLPGQSYLLRNDGGTFTDVTADMAPGLAEAGMVTSALWADVSGDGAADLVLTGEWMPITIFEANGKRLANATHLYGLEEHPGWWFSVAAKDMDNDGDLDLVAGNLGLNYKYKASPEAPFEIYVDDFDKNGSMDLVLGYYQGGEQFPVRGRSCSSQQVPAIAVAFENYGSFARASLQDIYGTANLQQALHYQATQFASCYLENTGTGFAQHPLPALAQVSPANSLVLHDVDADGHQDIIMVGNLHGAEVETPRADGGMGLWLRGNSQGQFKAVPTAASGLMAMHNAKNAATLRTAQGTTLLVANSNGPLQAIAMRQ